MAEPETERAALMTSGDRGTLEGVLSHLPVALSDEQKGVVAAALARHELERMPNREIALLGAKAEQDLHRTLDGFLSKIDAFDSPRLFKLTERLNTSVEAEQLPALADRILHAEPTLWERVVGLFSPRALERARIRVWEETKRLASGKAKNLADVVSTMERELREEQQRLEVELRNMDDLKAAYRERYAEYVQAVAFLLAFLDRSKSELSALQARTTLADHVEKQRLDDFTDKVNALESRALALAGTLARLPADQLVIRQLQNAGLATLQETTTSAASRFASIKMTLLTIHGTMMVGNVQRLASTGASLDANLLGVRSALMRETVQVAANAPGDNRLAQAEHLKSIVADTASLMNIVDQARTNNQAKFAQARQLFAEAGRELVTVGTS